jgi:invasion protein IalB
MRSFTDALIEVVMFKPIALVMMIALAAPAAAQSSTQQSAPAASKDKDPNRIICERQEEIGTRLGGKKVCKTAAQWDEERQQERQALDKFQRQNTSTGAPGGAI